MTRLTDFISHFTKYSERNIMDNMAYEVNVEDINKFNPKNYDLEDYIKVNGILYMISNNTKCDSDELMLIEVGTN